MITKQKREVRVLTLKNVGIIFNFVQYSIIIFPFPLSKLSYISFSAYLPIHGLFFKLIVITHIYLFAYAYIFLNISLYSIPFMYSFRAYHFVLDNQLVCPSLEKTTYLSHSDFLPSYLSSFLPSFLSFFLHFFLVT